MKRVMLEFFMAKSIFSFSFKLSNYKLKTLSDNLLNILNRFRKKYNIAI